MTQPSGWYDDPADTSRLRYWDGILWTDRTVPKESPTAGASTIGRTVDPYAAPGAPGAPGSSVQPPSYPPALTPYGQPPAGRDYGAAPTYQWRPSGPTTPDGVPLAQWWQRLLASILDSIIVQVVGAVLAFPWLRDFFVWYVDYLDRTLGKAGSTRDLTTLMAEVSERMGQFLLPYTLILTVLTLVYNTVFLAKWGATPGKMALSIRVRRAGRPGPLTVLEALRRSALPFVLNLAGLLPVLGLLASPASWLDNLWLLWDPRRQCLHDKVADTLVEQKPARRPGGPA